MVHIRKGQADGLERAVFRERFLNHFIDATFDAERAGIDRLEAIAWNNYREGRKAPYTRKAGPGFADPDYELSDEWRRNHEQLQAAAARQRDAGSIDRVLVINASSRNDYTCPGEMSKSFRLSKIVCEVIEGTGRSQADLLDLSLLTSDYGKHIHPCKGCVSTAMPLCHWPCSCYPNYSLGQINDAMADIYERFTAAHGVIIITPVYWYQATSPLKLMIDRLVCADGGNPDPTSTGGKNAERAKALELNGWPYPKHLAGRVYGVIVHGDVAGTEGVRRALSDWLDWMGLIDGGPAAKLDRLIGYYEPYATSHETLDSDINVQDEARNVARAVLQTVHAVRTGRYQRAQVNAPRPK